MDEICVCGHAYEEHALSGECDVVINGDFCACVHYVPEEA